jgi:hypothetical protein
MYKKYYDGKQKQFYLYGYAPPGCETGDYVVGQNVENSFRTVERYKEYKAVGFNMLMSGCTATYYGEDWESSMCKKVMDMVYEAGIDKYIVGDQAFYELSCQKDGIIGAGKKFANEAELDAFVADRIKNYSKHPAFYGLYLKDEPHSYLFKAFGEICRSIKRVRPQTFVYCNLLPLDTLRWMDERYPAGGDLMERRSKYLEMFLDETGCDYIMYDDYPFCYNKENKVLYLRCMQHAAELCRDRGIEFKFVAQSFSMKICNKDYYWAPNEQEMRYQLHLLLGFGIKELGFFTYMPHGANDVEQFPNDGAMLTREGKIMPLYYDTQKVLKELQDIIPVMMKFEYRHSAYAVKTFNSFLKQLDYMKNDKLINVESFETDREGVLVNELYDEENDQYLYRVINVAEVRCETEMGVEQNTVIKFDKKFKFADVFKDGKWSKIALNEGVLNVSLFAGDCVYVLIY